MNRHLICKMNPHHQNEDRLWNRKTFEKHPPVAIYT